MTKVDHFQLCLIDLWRSLWHVAILDYVIVYLSHKYRTTYAICAGRAYIPLIKMPRICTLVSDENQLLPNSDCEHIQCRLFLNKTDNENYTNDSKRVEWKLRAEMIHATLQWSFWRLKHYSGRNRTFFSRLEFYV